MDKKLIRSKIKGLKAGLSCDEVISLSDRIAARLFETEEYKAAEVIFAYMSYNQEVRMQPIIKRALTDGKKAAVPKTFAGRKMKFIFIDENTAFEEKNGIMEPSGGAEADCSALMIMPGLAFDTAGSRIGYGGGFYDRYIAESSHGFVKAALCYDFQVFDELECEEHDERTDIIITEKRIIKCKTS